MFEAEIVAAVTQLTSADPATCDPGGLAEIVSAAQRVRSWLDALDVRVAVAASRSAEAGSCETPGDVLSGGGRRAGREAAAAARRGKVCDRLAAVHDALAAGAVSAGHVDAIVRVADQLEPERAAERSPTLFADSRSGNDLDSPARSSEAVHAAASDRVSSSTSSNRANPSPLHATDASLESAAQHQRPPPHALVG